MHYCRVHGCHHRNDREKQLHYYRLPAVIYNQGEECRKLSEERRNLSLARLNQNFKGKNLENIRICSSHFISGRKAELYQKDHPDWPPSLRMVDESAGSPETETTMAPHVERYERKRARDERKAAAATDVDDIDMDYLPGCESSNAVNQGIQTDLTGQMIDQMFSDMQKVRSENVQLRAKTPTVYDRDSFEENNEKVSYFTGLENWSTLLALYEYLSPFLPAKLSMDKFTLLSITLARLRLNLPTAFIAYTLKISRSTVSRALSDVIDVMFARLQPLVMWPGREELQKTMPMQFRKHFGTRCVVIVDCFETFIDRPSNLMARAETWSSYKHHNTVKFLIGVTPQGTVSYISRAWGGRASDKYITERSGFLDMLLPGDLILADRGFNIQDSVGCIMAEVKVPAFTKGKSQLSPTDVETPRKIAQVRIHVERVIGSIRQKYGILNSQLPIDFLNCKKGDAETFIDKTVFVCSALVNMSPSIIDFT